MEDRTVFSCIRVVFISHCFCQGCAALSVSPKHSSCSCFHPLYGGYSSSAVCSTFGPRLFPSTVFLRNLHTLFCCGFLFYAVLTALNSVPICPNLDFFFLLHLPSLLLYCLSLLLECVRCWMWKSKGLRLPVWIREHSLLPWPLVSPTSPVTSFLLPICTEGHLLMSLRNTCDYRKLFWLLGFRVLTKKTNLTSGKSYVLSYRAPLADTRSILGCPSTRLQTLELSTQVQEY